MFKLYKNGDLTVNNATFEYICDSKEDLMKIPNSKINLGSTAIVINGEKGSDVYMSDSKDTWIKVTEDLFGDGGSSGSGETFVLTKEKIIAALESDVVGDIYRAGVKIEKLETSISAIKDEEIAPVKEDIENIKNDIETIKNATPEIAASKKYELLNEITADGSYNVLSLNKDDSGEDYNLMAAYIEFNLTKASGTASIRTFVNDEMVATNLNIMTANAANKGSVKVRVDGGFIEALSSAGVSSNTNAAVQTYGTLMQGAADAINKIELVSGSTVKIPSGSVIKVYGIKG